MAKNNNNLTVKELVDKALLNMTLNLPIFADLIIKIGVKLVNNPGIRACAWTNGTAIYINECIVDELRFGNPKKPDNKKVDFTYKKMIYTLSHELMHLLNLTFDRGKDLGIFADDQSTEGAAKFKLWNVATDYEINSLLLNNRDGSGKSKPVGEYLDGTLYSEDYIDIPAEKIYHDLLQKSDNNASSAASDIQYTFDDTENEEGEGISFDAHMPIADDTTRQEVLSKIRDCLANRSDGHTESSAIDRAFQRTFKKEPFNWKKALTKYIRGYIKANYTWNKPSRSGQALGLILPSAGKTPKMRIGVAIDTSGSIGEQELQGMINHVFTILNVFNNFQVDVWCCGMQVYQETLKTFTQANKKELLNYQLKSDGCNDMVQNIKFVNDKYKMNKLDALIIFSDFYDAIDGSTECPNCNCPVIFLCVDHEDFKKPSNVNGVVFNYTIEKKN